MKLLTVLESYGAVQKSKSVKMADGAKIVAKIVENGSTNVSITMSGYPTDLFPFPIRAAIIQYLSVGEPYYESIVKKLLELSKVSYENACKSNQTARDRGKSLHNELDDIIANVCRAYEIVQRWTTSGKLDKIRAQRELLEKDLEDYADLT